MPAENCWRRRQRPGPSGRIMERMSERGNGLRSGCAGSMRAFTHEPSSTTCANSRSWLMVRADSPFSRASGSAVSRCARSTSSGTMASMPSAMWRRKRAFSRPGKLAVSRKCFLGQIGGEVQICRARRNDRQARAARPSQDRHRETQLRLSGRDSPSTIE